MTEHVSDRLADLVEGRLGLEELRDMESHLLSCPECAAELEFARALRRNALEQGLMHLPTERIVALATDEADIVDMEAQHLSECESCSTELAWVRDNESGRGNPDTAGPAPWRRGRVRLWSLSVLAAAAALLTFILLEPGGPSDLEIGTRLARLEPIGVNITRRPVTPGSPEEMRVRGLEYYRDGDHARARESLLQAVEQRPEDSELWLYLGSSSLILGEMEAAIRELRQCVTISPSNALRAEAGWQLANAYLATGELKEAQSTLESIADSDVEHAGDAQRILSQLQDR